MTPPLDLEALRAALEKATPGVPEIVRYDDVSSDINYQLHFPGGDINVREGDFDNRAHAKSTAAAIVALMNAAPRLLAIAKAVQAIAAFGEDEANEDAIGDVPDALLELIMKATDAATKGGG